MAPQAAMGDDAIDQIEGGATNEDTRNGPLTAEELRRAAAITSSSRPDNQPFAVDVFTGPRKTPERGMRINTGPIAEGPYHPPLDLDPRNVDALLTTDGERAQGDVLGWTRAAFASTYAALEQVNKARVAASANDSWTPAQQLLKVGEMSDKASDRVLQAFDKARKQLSDFITALDAQMSAPLKGDPFAVEIREHVKKLPEAKRGEFVSAAMKRGDKQILGAILGAPAYLSGLSEAHFTTFLRQFHETSNPAAAARLAVAKKGQELIDSRSGAINILTQFERAQGGTFARLKKLREAQSAAEAALIMQTGDV